MPRGVMTDLPRKRCKNCPEIFRPSQRNQDFCCANCRKEFNKHGAAFGPLNRALDKKIANRIKVLSPADQVRMDSIEKRLAFVERFIGGVRAAFLLDYSDKTK
jgi:hypothetical protein